MASSKARSALYVALVGVSSLAALSGCGVQQPADLTTGQQLFTQKCGSCHILKAAGTEGTTGPNLDLAFAGSLKSGMGRSTVKGIVETQIKFPQGKEMPANLVGGADAKAVAAYVAEVVATESSK